MNPAWWAVGIAGASGVCAWLTFVAKLLWGFRGQWDTTNQRLDALAKADGELRERIDIHLAWHDQPGVWPPRRPPRARQ